MGGRILGFASRDDDLDLRLNERPIDECPGCLGSVPAATPIGNHAVADRAHSEWRMRPYSYRSPPARAGLGVRRRRP